MKALWTFAKFFKATKRVIHFKIGTHKVLQHHIVQLARIFLMFDYETKFKSWNREQLGKHCVCQFVSINELSVNHYFITMESDINMKL